MRPNYIVRVICKFVSKEFSVFLAGCPGHPRIKRVNAVVERFVFDGNVDIFGKTSNSTIDLRERGAALKMPWKGDRVFQKGPGAPSKSKYPSPGAPPVVRFSPHRFAVCQPVLRVTAVRSPQTPVASFSYRCSVSAIQAAQFGVRESTASSRQHASRLAASPSFRQPGTLSLRENTDRQSSGQMSATETFNLSLIERAKEATGEEQRGTGNRAHVALTHGERCGIEQVDLHTTTAASDQDMGVAEADEPKQERSNLL